MAENVVKSSDTKKSYTVKGTQIMRNKTFHLVLSDCNCTHFYVKALRITKQTKNIQKKKTQTDKSPLKKKLKKYYVKAISG